MPSRIGVDTRLAYHEDFRDGRRVFEDVLEEYVASRAAPAWAGTSAGEEQQRLMLGIPNDLLYQLVPLTNRDAADQSEQ